MTKPVKKSPTKKPARKPAAKKPAKRTRSNPFSTRAGAEVFIMESLNAYRKDYESQVELLKDSLKQVEAELRSPAKSGIPKTALIEARVSILSSIKTMQTNYSRFLLDLINKKQLLSALDPPKQEDAGGLVINFTLPDFEKIEVVLTGPGPPAEADDEVNPEEIET